LARERRSLGGVSLKLAREPRSLTGVSLKLARDGRSLGERAAWTARFALSTDDGTRHACCPAVAPPRRRVLAMEAGCDQDCEIELDVVELQGDRV
jgi:hypothetical protein